VGQGKNDSTTVSGVVTILVDEIKQSQLSTGFASLDARG
jgi:hypothetical protein